MIHQIVRNKFQVQQIKKETKDIVTIFLCSSDKKFVFKAGQYVAVYLDKDKPAKPKFYTISSSPSDKFISISVKKTGTFSSSLHQLKVGDFIYVSGPFGHLYPKRNKNKLVFLASGVGIVPFVSIIKYHDNKNIKYYVDVYYTCKKFQDLIFYKDLNEIAQRNKNLKIHYFLTKDKKKNEMISKYGRVSAKFIKKELKTLNNRNFYLCGSADFVADLSKQLTENGVKDNNIFTETFF